MTPANSKTLVYSPNWLGDSIMAMPALAALKQASACGRLTVLCRPTLEPLWACCGFVDDLATVESGVAGTFRAAGRIKAMAVSRSYSLPNSFRSALIPFLAGVPERIGPRGHHRAWLLTRSVADAGVESTVHQSREMAALLGVSDQDLEMPELQIPAETIEACRRRLADLDGTSPLLALVPGAARGPSKQWPRDHFVATGRLAAEQLGAHCLVLGSGAERELCESVASGIGAQATSLAGETSLLEFAATVQRCGVAVTNDSGGMHLAAASGAAVVAIYGITDPARTGPLGDRHRVLQDSDVRSRDVPRESALASERLARITPAQAFDAVASLMQ
ncbi:MAG: lipopolysaccharide heptosyltransferase II [Verrucomicrobia bacterium]|nr:lipopolysaccharide heptosyltransferase II [Verrucomicrobiota bacterium]MDA1088049.1 lipopolysaccharide heptosyltransferase II [Verrucomicrobiota bacterium]